MAKKMKAAYYEAFGGPDQVKIGELEIPALQEGEVLVRVKAAGVNPVDNAVLAGWLSSKLPMQYPAIPGWDVAGVVEDRGFSSRRFNVGDEVYAYARRPTVQHGTFAEYLVIPESYLAHKPKNLSFEEAAGIPLVGLTAYQSMFDVGQLQAGQTVLILGASGGIGNLGIQLAKWKGATVIGVASQKNHTFMKELGADHTLDYNGTHVGEAVKELFPDGVDLIFDAASGETLQQSLIALKSGGKLVSILNTGENLDKSIDFTYVFVEPNSTELEHLRELAEAGILKVHVSDTYPLDQAVEALNQIASHHTKGKIVVVP
ncbi:NADP-dependent oxidoreductase [Rufibacter latericius]|uniref:NADP-dependent oxidoreductase n=1 Tax=Rufibacter latericius TaxID=2487040 RepID=A0A3M9M8H1_9BACT|nr:NADP-dependent oxidoreductase [Rufibacter latericius]RNI21864.1 NADP-dependent oxidoreductase [Rufibacter latericius]